MTPSKSRLAQIEKYRRMTGEQRLLVGLRLHELACEIARDSIRASLPDATEQDVESKLQSSLRLAYACNADKKSECSIACIKDV